jgi:hypothetical protein
VAKSFPWVRMEQRQDAPRPSHSAVSGVQSPESSYSASGVARARTHSALPAGGDVVSEPMSTCPLLGQKRSVSSFVVSDFYCSLWARLPWGEGHSMGKARLKRVLATKRVLFGCSRYFFCVREGIQSPLLSLVAHSCLPWYPLSLKWQGYPTVFTE